MSDVVIQVDSLWKKYRLGGAGHGHAAPLRLEIAMKML